MKRLIFMAFAVCLLAVCLLALPAEAEASTVASGTCGENATWVLDDTGTLTITGTGYMNSYYDWDYDDAPWYDLRSSIVKIVVGEGITHIGYRCFADCNALETVELPQSLKSIGGGAFSGCGFTGITLPQNLQTIEGSAFYNCTSLECIVIPDSVESVYVNSFFDCTALKEVTIGTGVTMLGPQVFKNCTALEKVYFNAINVKDLALYHDTFYNAGANGPGITMVIGKDVTRIPGALTHSQEEANVTALVFEEGSVCTSIGWESFSGTNIQVLEFPSSMEVIESNAFSNCSSLVRVCIPDNVKKVEYMAFWNCESLQQVTVGKGLELGIPGAFPNCTKLKSVHVDAQNATYYSDAEGVVFSKDRKTLVFLPQGYGSEYTVPDFVKTIGESSISGNPNLTKLTIPGNVEKIAGSSIGSCNALTTVELPEGLVSIGVNAFSGNQKLTGITIPDSVVTVGDYAFDMCESLSRVYIGKGVTTLGERVFGFYGVQNSIGVHPENRYYCNDNGALYDKNKTTLIMVVRNTAGSFEVPQGVKTIEANCFYGCEEITQIILPDSVTKIENNAFNGCAALTEIELPEGLERLEGAAFVACRKLVQMRIPDGVEDIDGTLFHGCESLETVTFGTGLKRIWNDMFYGCTSLETMIFTGNAPQIDNYAFSGLVAMAYYPGADSSWTTDKLQGYDGSITWIPVLEQVDDLRLTTPSVLTGYIVGDVLDPSQIGVEVLSGGQWLQMPYKVLQISPCDMTTAGRKTVTVSYGGRSAAVTVLVHEMDSLYVDPALYPESEHKYSNYCSETKTLTIPGASRLVLTFSPQTAFENGFDKLRVLDGNYALVAEFTGTEAAGVTLSVTGDTVRLYLSSDGSATYYGYSFTDISAKGIKHAYENGECSVCGVGEKPVGGYVDGVYTGYEDLAAAIAAGGWVKLYADATVNVTLTRDLYIDLNGFDLSGTITANGYKVYGMDSTTDSYNCAAIGYMKLVDENGNEIVPVGHFKSDITGTSKRYMAIKDENGYSFHRFYLGITHMSVRPTTTGVGYKGVFYGDEMVAANLSGFGFTLQLQGNDPVTVTMDADKFVSGKVFTLRLDNFDVEKYGETTLFATATLQLADGTVIQSTAASMTMRSLMEQLNAAADTLSEAQLTTIKTMIEKYVIIKSWKVENLI